MTFAPPEVSRAATRRIGAANAVLWVVGSIILAIVGATAAYAFVIVPYGGGGYLGGAYYPWEADQPIVATQNGDVWSADAAGVIRIPAAEFTEAHEAEPVGAGELELYRTNPAEGMAYTDDYFWPWIIGHVVEGYPQVIVPSGDDLELWVGAEGPWQLRLTPIDADVMTDEGASGRANAYLIYRGDAVSATFTHVGDGTFFVSISTAFTQDTPIIEVGDFSQRVSWEPDTFVVLEIESSGGAWTIDIDELARPTPTPTPTEIP
jgi:hypothetical protein